MLKINCRIELQPSMVAEALAINVANVSRVQEYDGRFTRLQQVAEIKNTFESK